MRIAPLVVVALIASGIFLSSTTVLTFTASAQSSGNNRLGFWVDERDIWSGIGFCWSASQFVQNYFEEPPYPSAMILATAMQPSGGCSPGATGEATWLSQVASDAQADGLNVEIIILFFVNLSGQTVNGVADQTAQLQQFMSNLGYHSNIYGAEYEREYYGNTVAENQAFGTIIQNAGYTWILDPSVEGGFSGPVLDYSTYPYFGASIDTSPGSGSRSIGVGYGETGAPSGNTPNPCWTQQSVDAIVDTSYGNPYVMLYAGAGGSGQPSWQLWNWSTLQQWIWTDSHYQANFILSTSSPPTTSTTTTVSSTTTSTTHSTSSTTSSTTTTSRSSSSTSTSSSTTSSKSSTSTTSSTSTSSKTSTSSTTSSRTSSSTTSATSSTTSSKTSTTSSTTSTTTTTSPTKTSTSTTSTTTSSSATTSSTSTKTTSSSTTKRGATSTGPDVTNTATGVSPPDFPLSVQGGCPSTGAGSYPSGTAATVQFDSVCDRSGGSGIRVTSWSLDGGNSVPVSANETSTITVLMDQSHTITLQTTSQYSLTLDYGAVASLLYLTPPSVPGDNYGYDSGTLVTFAGSVGLNSSNAVAYSLDGSTTDIAPRVSGYTTSFVMNAPHSLVVVLAPISPACPSGACTTQFSVTIQSGSNLPGGAWVDGKYYPKPVTFSWPGGSVHNVTAVAGAAQPQVRASFNSWTGIATSKSTTLALMVNKTGTLTAQYSKQYLVTLHFSDSAGGIVVPQSVTLAGPSGRETIGANMSAWVSPNVSYTISSVQWMDWNVVMSNDSTFRAAQPASLGFTVEVYPQTIRVTDAYGLPLQGAVVDVTTLNGKTISLATNADGVATFEVPMGLFSANIGYFGVNNQITSASEGSHAFIVGFLLSYPLIATIGAMLGGACTYMYFKRRKRVAGGPRYYAD